MNSSDTSKKRLIKFLIFFSPLIAYWSFQSTSVSISGATMGTTYSIRAYIPRWMSTSSLKEEIDARLVAINKSMSTWDKTSEISIFNKMQSSDEIKITDDFFKVLKKSQYVYRITDGAWDGTVEPILKLWKFSQKNDDLQKDIKYKITKKQVSKILPIIGFDKIKLIKPNFLKKTKPNLSINLSSIAKGYGVDEIARLLQNKDIKSYFVEIGGEVFAKNKKFDGTKWRVGISKPNSNNLNNEIFHTVALDNQAIATSGDYRNYITIDNKRFSHIINPKTGMPVTNNITSVSVIANTTMLADALATAFMVMGVEKSINLANKLDDIDVLIITIDKKNVFKTILSDNFPKHTKE